MTTHWFSIDMFLLTGGSAFFSGYFSVAMNGGASGIVTNFYNYANPAVNIYINNGFDGQDSVFYTTPSYTFSRGGTNITSLPYLASSGTFFNLYDTGGISFIDINGHSIGGDTYNFVFKPITSPYPLPVNYCCNLYTDNALVYYKPHSLAAGGVGGVRNNRSKARRT